MDGATPPADGEFGYVVRNISVELGPGVVAEIELPAAGHPTLPM
jgi:hypothetical protein